MDQPSVLLVSEDPEFSRSLMSRWQSERAVPGFVVMAGESGNTPVAAFDLAIVGPTPAQRLDAVLAGLAFVGRPVLHVFADETAVAQARLRFPQVVWLRQHEEWLGTTVVIGREMLRSTVASERARRAEQQAGAHQRDAALGRYISDMRHGFNNALTSVLGNAELILLDEQAITPAVRDKIKTIQTMALRMHEMMRRLSSLESEFQLTERDKREPRSVRAAATH